MGNDRHYSAMTLDMIALRALESYDIYLVNGSPCAIPIEKLIEGHGLEIQYQYLRKSGRLLGQIVFDDGAMPVYDIEKGEYRAIEVTAGTIFIDGRLAERRDVGRLRFTQAHELSHWLLHKKLYLGQHEAASYDEETDGSLEWQANYLASAILLPRPQVKKAFYQLRPSIKSPSDAVTKLADFFEVSKQAAKIRLESFNLI